MREGKSSGVKNGWILTWAVLISLVAVGLIFPYIPTEGAEFSPKEAKAYHDDAFTREAKWARIGETLHIRAVNSTSTSSPASGDYLYLYVNSTSNSTGFVMNLTYQSDYYFTCNLTLGNTTNQTAGNYTIEVTHGDSVYIRSNANRSVILYTIKVDNQPPRLDVKVSGQGFMEQDRIYLLQGDVIRLTPSDTDSGVHSTTYSWDGGSYTEYNETTGIKSPTGTGRHILSVMVEDEATNLAQFTYTVWTSINWTAGKVILSNETLSYTNATIFSGNLTVFGSLTLRSCNLIFVGADRHLEVMSGGFFGITDYDGNPSTTGDISRVLPSPDSTYALTYRAGSKGWINSTEIRGAGVGGVAIYAATDLDIVNVEASLRGSVMLDGGRVRIESSDFEVMEGEMGLLYDGHHRTFSSTPYIGNTTLTGPTPYGLVVKNLSVERTTSTLRYSGFTSSENRTLSYVNTFGAGESLRFSYIFPEPAGACGALIASPDLLSWVTLYNLTPTDEWRLVEINMSAYASQSLELRFYFNAPNNYTGSGYYITDPVIITPSTGMGMPPFSGNFSTVTASLKGLQMNNVSISSGERVQAAFTGTYEATVVGLKADGSTLGTMELLNLTSGDVELRDSTFRGSPAETLYGLTVVGGPTSTFHLLRCRIREVNGTGGYLVRVFGGEVVLEDSVFNNSREGILLMDGTLQLLDSAVYNITGTGVMAFAPSSAYRPAGRLPILVKDSTFSHIGSCGMLIVVPPYGEGGGVRINNTFMVNVSYLRWEPVVVSVDPSITSFRTVIEDLTIRDSWGALNISSPAGAEINGLTEVNIRGMGVRLGGGGVFNLSRFYESQSTSVALYLEEGATLNMATATIRSVSEGIILEGSSAAAITGLTLNGSGGNGIRAMASSSVKITSSTITGCSGTGILTEEGARVELRQVHVDRCGEGIILDDPRIEGVQNVWTQQNSGDGLRIILGPNLYSYLGSRVEVVDGVHSTDNDGYGLRLVHEGSGTFTLVMKNFTLYGNLLPDLKADEGVRVLLKPVTALFDGATMEFNGRLEVMDTVYLLTRGVTIDFFGEDSGVLVESGGFLNMQGATIRSLSPERPYTFEVYGGALLTSSYFGGLDMIYVSGSDAFTIRGCRVDAQRMGLHILRSTFTVERTSVSGVNTGIYIVSSAGAVIDSRVTSNFVGIFIKDLGEEVSVEGTTVGENVYGIRAENSGEQLINISGCTFLNNDVSDLMVRATTLTVYFSTIDVGKIAVLDPSSRVYVYYGLDLYLFNEVGGPLTADVVITDSSGAVHYSSSVDGSELNIPLLGYTVTSGGPTSTHQPYTVTVTTASGQSAEEDLTITSHTVLGITINAPPILIGTVPTIYIREDESAPGVLDLTDYVQDRDDIIFSVTRGDHIGAEVDSEGLLSLYPLVENWYGTETLFVRAEDTFGSYVEFTITVICQPVNDPPVYRNVTLLPRHPVTGDTLTAHMTFYDVDGDPEPGTILIQWYRNDELVPLYSNQLQVPDVKAGERWYFEVRAWDGHSASENGYGELYRSEEVVVGNHPPVVSGVRIVESAPRTIDDLHVVVVDYYDPDSPMVEFMIQWQYLDGERWVTLPVMGEVLPSEYTSRGMSIRAAVSGFDGLSWSDAVASESVTVVNTPPQVLEARFIPERVLQTTQQIRVEVVESYDPDGDYIEYYYTWKINGREVLSGYDNHTLSRTKASFTSGDVISCEIRPTDPYGFGPTYSLEVVVEPVDTDGDGLFDDYNGNGRNDGADDTDDDGDGYLDEWEEFMGTNPKDPSSRPKDTDGDGAPDGDASNSQSWMDTDDDNDGFPDSIDDFPTLPTEWKDTDRDGVGDNSDTDIDGDGIPNWKDYDPYDPSVWKAPVKKESRTFEYFISALLLLLLLAVLAGGYLLYTGRIKVPVQGEVRALEAPEMRRRPSVGIPEEVEFEAEEELEEELEEEEMEELEELVECGSCHELIPADSRICPSCGAKLVEE